MRSRTRKAALHKRERRRKAWQMRLGGSTLQEIADKLNCCQATAGQDVRAAFEEYQVLLREEAINAADLQLARVEKLLSACWDNALSGDTKAIHTAMKLLELQAKMLGLLAPPKQTIELTSPDSMEALRMKIKEALEKNNEQTI